MLPCGRARSRQNRLFARPCYPANMTACQPERLQRPLGGVMTIEKCINEFGVDDVIFEEGSTGRELFVVVDGQVEIAKVTSAGKTVIITLGKGEFFGEMAVIVGSSRSPTAIAVAPDPRVMLVNH